MRPFPAFGGGKAVNQSFPKTAALHPHHELQCSCYFRQKISGNRAGFHKNLLLFSEICYNKTDIIDKKSLFHYKKAELLLKI